MDNQARDRGRSCNICRIYATVLTNFYPLVCILVLAIAAACACVSFILYDLPDFDEPTKGFEARGTPITTSLISYVNYKFEDNEDLFAQGTLDYYTDSYSNQPAERRRRDADDTVSPPSPLGNTTGSMTTRDSSGSNSGFGTEYPNTQMCVTEHPNADKARIVFGAKGKNNLFTAQAMKGMCELEEEIIRSHSKFAEACNPCNLIYSYECLDSWSLGGYVALLNNKRSCKDVNSTDVDNARMLLKRCAPFYLNESLTELCSINGDCTGIPNECTTYDAVYLILHFITPDGFARDIMESENARLRLAMTFLPIYNRQDDSRLKAIYLDNIHGKTIAEDDIVTLKAVKFSIKFALFEQFLFSDIIYVGIGMAVILVLLWIYTKSFLVMIAALLNFILSLLLAYFLYVVVLQRPFFPFVNITALILLIGIGADDTFVYMDLWRKALSEHRGQRLVIVVEDSLRHATATMFVTSATTTSALFASMISDITAVKCFSLFTGITILMNFVLTITWLPSVIILQHRLMEICCKSEGNDADTNGKCSRTLEWLLTPFRVFFDKILPFIVVKFRYVWLITLTLVGIGGAVLVFFKPGLKLPTSSEFQILRTENYLEQYDLIYKNDFKFESDSLPRMRGNIVFGIQSKYNGDPWDPDDFGDLFVDDSFDFSSEQAQVWMQNFCDELKNQSFYYSENYYSCLIEPLKFFMARDCSDESSPCCKESTFPYSASVLDTCMRECLASGYCYGISVKYSVNGDKLAAIDFDFLSTTFRSFDFGIMDRYWKDVNKWMDAKFKTAPASLSNGLFTALNGDQLWFFDLQQSLATGTPISLGLTLVIAAVILIFTILNILLALYAIVSVAFVVFVTMGSLVLLGWELNIFESVIFTLAVGLSVDFTIHYGVAYNLAPFQTRTERTEFSIQTMGSAITIAALSTFIAGAIMLPSTVNAYLQLGVFLMLVMSISWVYSTFYFQALCNVIGPQGKIGQLTACCTDDEPTMIGNQIANGDPLRESSKKIDTISGNATEVHVGDINMGSVSPNNPDVVPSVALLPGTPHKGDEDSDIGANNEGKPEKSPLEGMANPVFTP